MCVNRARKTVMSKLIFRDTARAKVFGRKHAASGHDAYERVELWFRRVLRTSEIAKEMARLTTHASSDAASAPELETSSVMPLRLAKISCNVSKLVFGGGLCLLNTAVCGNVSWILAATLTLASSMNSSTRLLVSYACFCSTSTGSADSAESRWILSSGDESERAPARIRAALSLIASLLSSRTELVRGSFNDLGESAS
jgi:hypothetical protein